MLSKRNYNKVLNFHTTPTINLFSLSLNNQLPTYESYKAGPNEHAFYLKWSQSLKVNPFPSVRLTHSRKEWTKQKEYWWWYTIGPPNIVLEGTKND